MHDDSARLHGPRYLLSVIGFSSVPRLITSVLSLIVFPLLVRAIGATEYGIFVYVSAVLNVLVLFADFGVASAAGKTIAEARLRGAIFAREALLRSARLQTVVGDHRPDTHASDLLGSCLGVDESVSRPTFVVVMVMATWTSVAATFVRSCLQSYLAFGWLAVLDTVESIVRTVGWSMVAWFAPTYMSLAWATLITSVVSTVLAITILILENASATNRDECFAAGTLSQLGSYRELLKDSASFLSVGLATRVFQSIPFILFGRLLAPRSSA